MMTLDMIASGWLRGITVVLFTIVCVLLIIVVLLQKGRGGGLAGAFGGAGGYSAFGSKTGDVFTWITVALTGLFFVLAVVGNYVFVPDPASSLATPALQAPAPAGPEETGAAAPAEDAGGGSPAPAPGQ